MSRRKNFLKKINGLFFVFGGITSNLKNTPHPVISSFLRLTSLIANFMGYCIWYYFNLTEKPIEPTVPFDFMDVQTKYQMAALLGVIATLLCILLPALLIQTAWLFTLSNILWAHCENQKRNNPPKNNCNYSTEQQTIYCYYTNCVATISLLTSLTITALYLWPTVIIQALPLCSAFGTALSLLSFGFFIHYRLGKFESDMKSTSEAINTNSAHSSKPSPRPDAGIHYDSPLQQPTPPFHQQVTRFELTT